MEHYDLVIIGGQVVSSDHIFPATVAVRGGRIAAVLAPEETPSAADVIHADGLHILPGIIDPHVHLRAPDRPDREDLLSGTSAAAAGGITTILEMPISEPPVNSGAVLAQRAKLWEGESLVDYAMYGAAGFENLDEIQSQAEAGANSRGVRKNLPVYGVWTMAR
jgi:dihydroorotase-like cyclic amidohydrolase